MSRKPLRLFIVLVAYVASSGVLPATAVQQKDRPRLVKLSQDFLYAVRTGEDPNSYLRSLTDMDSATLVQTLDSDSKKKAFWINIYNAFIQMKAKKNPDMVKDGADDFFKKKWIRVASMDLSFDDIEHGILRASHSVQDRQLQVENVDCRIHFALNCGAVSCPPIAFYSEKSIDRELDQATRNFLTTDTRYTPDKNTVIVSRIFKWYETDFGGEKGILDLLNKYDVIPRDARPEIKYKKYDWTLALENYVK
jgi:hypothetical protein